MNDLLIIARFEFRYHLRQPAFYLFAVLIFGQGLWYAIALTKSSAGSDASANAYFVLSSLGVGLAVVAVLLAGQSLTKDIEYRTAPYLYPLPVTSRAYFAGRFLGTNLTVLVLAVFYPLGTLLLPLVYPTYTVNEWALTDGYIRLIVPNLFIIVSISFSLTILLGGIRGAYLTLFVVALYFLLTEAQPDVVADSDLWQLLDPFGVGMARASVETMRLTNDADGWLVFSDMLFINRLLWLGLSLGLLTRAERSFSFETFGLHQRTSRSEPKSMNQAGPISLPTPRLSFSPWARWHTITQLAKGEFLALIRQSVFLIVLVLLVMLTTLLATVFGQNPDFLDLPTTARMTALRQPMGIFISLFLLVMTGELIFQERTTGFWPIYDALPQPRIVLLLAKLLALSGVAALLTLILFLTGIGIQGSRGFTDIDWSVYASDLIVDGFFRYVQIIAFGSVVAVLVANRLLGHFVALSIFSVLWLTYQFRFVSEASYLYSFLPGSDAYSDLIGYGANGPIRPIVHAMWWGLAAMFMTLAVLAWPRGVPVRLGQRVRQWHRRFNVSYGIVLLLFGGLFLFNGWLIRHRTVAGVLENSIPVMRYATRTWMVPSVSGRVLSIRVVYQHPYQVRHMADAARRALQTGERLFGPYPYAGLQILETPGGSVAVRSVPGRLLISERQGWTADNRQPDDYVDYLLAREVFKQWIVHRAPPVRQAGDGFVSQSLAEYLALRVVAGQYGTGRLKQRLAQRAAAYVVSRNRSTQAEVPLLQSSGNDAVERQRAALVLTSIGQVWSDSALCQTIGQYYRQAVERPASATATAFAATLTRRLPDSLRYLTTYLSDRLWFDFRLGRVANLPNGLSVEVVPQKWRDTSLGKRQPLPINDLVPVSITDRSGRELYRTLVRPEPDQRWISLPTMPNAAVVVIDPLGTWPELNKRDNRKIF